MIMTILFLIAHLIGLALIGHVLLSRKSHASLILWTMWLLLFPMLGIPLYLFLGTQKIHRKKMERFERIEYTNSPEPDKQTLPDILKDLQRVNGHRAGLMEAPQLMWGGDDYYEALIKDIGAAETYVHIQTYVWREDEAGRRVLDALCAAAERGVQTRILLDEMGAFKTSRDFFERFEKAGGRFSWCSTVQTRRSRFFFNLRNHRKINIIDGAIAYVGGMNIGEEYAGRSIGPWQDLQMRLRGPIVKDLESSVASDWSFATGERLDEPVFYPDTPVPEDAFPAAVVQTGPDHADLPFLNVFSLLCREATETMDVFTPYFVPNEHLMVMLQVTAARGVRVRMLIPTLNEHMYMVDIGRAYYEALMQSGVEIYELPGMVHHAKVLRIDDDLVFAGSHNLDTRSYKLNFELSLCFRHRETAQKMDAHFDELFEKASRIDLDEFSRRPLVTRLKQGFVRLFGPVL